MKLYSGSEFEIFKEYSLLITFTWVTFLFAPGLPILFPIALIYMIVLYTTDRLTLAYWWRRPPVFDEKMNATTIRLLGIAPLLYCCMAAWLYNNQQAFRNQVVPNEHGDIFMPAHHSFSDLYKQLSPGSVFIVYLALLFFMFCSKALLKCCKMPICQSMRSKVD